MPSKIDDASNVQFLYACLESATPNRIDYGKVAKKFGIQTPAARMRFHRLREGKGGKPTAKVSKTKLIASRRKQGSAKKLSKEGLETNWKGMNDDEDDDDEEIDVGKKEGRGGSLKKEEDESDGENAWKNLPEAVLTQPSGEVQTQVYGMGDYDQAATIPQQMAPTHHDHGQLQPQTQLVGVATDIVKNENGFSTLLEGYAHPSAYVAMPQTAYGHNVPDNDLSIYQPEQNPQFHEDQDQ
jgi:hypothetical protein